MKAYIIESGHFSKAGNFIAYSTKGERIHIYKKQIFEEFPDVETIFHCTGQYDASLITFPFYCVAEEKTFDMIDFDGKKTGGKFTRLTAVEISESTLGIVTYTMSDWVAEVKDAISDRAAERISEELARAKKNYRRLENRYDELMKEHDALVAKVEHYDHSATEENDKLKAEIESLKEKLRDESWEAHYQQSERERLALIIINAREFLASCDLGLSLDKIDQLINNR